jgi:hypothetical protein
MRLVAVLAALSIGLLAAPASGASVRWFGLRDVRPGMHVIPPTTDHVYYHGGPVLHSNRTHLIFWQPKGSGLRFRPGYVSLIRGFMRNVAAASHRASVVFGLTGQYTDYTGRPAAYASQYGGSVTDTDRLPANGCVEPSTGPRWTHCLTDSQLQAELEHVVRVDRLAHGPDDVYFLLLPRGLASCFSSSRSSSCTLAGPTSGYCGYHSVTNNALLLYAVIPYNAVPGHCQSNNPRPNHSPADPAINTMSHELSETVTDPDQSAWYDNQGEEIADICFTSYGRALGGSGNGRYNEIVNGGHYWLQELWSNADHACRPRAAPDRVSFSVVKRTGQTLTFRARAYDPEGLIRSYRWSFGDGHTARSPNAVHTYRHPGSYRVQLRVVDSWGNYAYAAAMVHTSPRPD